MRLLNLTKSILQNRCGAVSHPSWCTYLVCYRCNARCGMCDSWRLKPGSELTAEQVRQVFRKVGRLDVVRLTGGEPFLREDFAEVAAAVVDEARPTVLHITTNGSFPQRVAAFVRQFRHSDRLRFLVSFDGGPAEHDANRGADVTFQTATECVESLAGLREQYGLQVSVNHTVISRQSLRDHQHLRQKFEPLGIDVHSVLAYSDSSMYGIKRQGKKSSDLIVAAGYPLHPDLDLEESIEFTRRQLAELDEIRDPWMRRGKRYYLRGLLARLTNEQNARPHPRCVALRSHLRLLPDGSVPVCQFNSERVGNLLNQSLAEVWHGAAAGTSRAWVDACPGCWAECEVIPSALFTGDILLNS